ncbi:MAG: ABC transporter permease [Elusimicrobiales bacterium]|jgi:ABC-2 type transport system permease protein|nr:ABC transporter permease [Elusimicrobiales bacterium]
MFNFPAIYALLMREALIYFREKERIASILVSPLLFLFVVGKGLSGSSPVEGYSYQQFIFPGIVVMVILFTSITYGLYIIWDKRLDFLKEVLAAPISRTTLFMGKAMGGMLGGIIETLLLLAIGMAFVMPLTLWKLLLCLAASVPVAYMITNIGLVIGAKMKSMEGFGLVMSFLTWPMFFFSGALFDLATAAPYIRLVALVDPVTYAVDLMRYVLIGYGYFPPLLSLGALLGFCAVTTALGVAAFGAIQQEK